MGVFLDFFYFPFVDQSFEEVNFVSVFYKSSFLFCFVIFIDDKEDSVLNNTIDSKFVDSRLCEVEKLEDLENLVLNYIYSINFKVYFICLLL